MDRNTVIWACAASALALAGCGKRSSFTVTKPKPIAVAAGADAPTAETPPATQHGSRKMQNVDIPVWVDGKQMAVLRYGELPSTVKPHTSPEHPKGGARFYRLDEYLKEIGIPVERIRSVHVLGNQNRVASIEGDELRADKGRFIFDFLGETTGNAKTRWATTGLKNLSVVHEIRSVSVYVDKPSPAIDPRYSCHLSAGVKLDGADRRPADEVCAADDPYSTGERAKGTRVYIDGRLAGYVKRRQIPESMVVGNNEAGEHTFSLTKFMTSLGADVASARAIELVSGDDVIARTGGAAWMKHEKELVFTLPKHQHGRVSVHVPAEVQAKAVEGDDPVTAHDTTVTAVHIHKNTPASAHELLPIVDESPEPQDGTVAARESRRDDREN
ncbi:hypothetical protein LZC95_17765 [Pendulispora brunnea]|uniref:Uncharacterized protein n=1 Tax=Pendulispora brunnea TaxID=2905690 RepID=A0ABZ2KJE6_9BACT